MKVPTMARDLVAAASTTHEPVKLNMELKLPSGICPVMPDLSLKCFAIWKIQSSNKVTETASLSVYSVRRNERLSFVYKQNPSMPEKKTVHLFYDKK